MGHSALFRCCNCECSMQLDNAFCETAVTTLFIFLLINRGTFESMDFEICVDLEETPVKINVYSY